MPLPEKKAPTGHRILIVDDDEKMARMLCKALSSQGHHCVLAFSGEQGLAQVHSQQFDLIITDQVMPGFDGVTFVRSVKAIDSSIPIIMMTGHGSIDMAVEAMKAGAFDFLTKPVRLAELQVYVDKALESHEMLVEVKELKDRLKNFQKKNMIVGKSQAMRNIITQIEQIAPSSANVLITGETGTGKEMIAEAIHALSPRSAKPIVKVNCGALPESLLESELFGHVKGSFTGAYKDHQGRFESANGGTIFLDEIGEMSPSAQVRLLRVLQEGEFERVGSSQPVQVDVRVIVATNRDLYKMVREGKFRRDLLYRINVFHLELPPLRERRGDIPLLAQHFIEKYAQKNGKNVHGLGQYAYEALENYDWPGNVRELENVIEHGVILARGDLIRLGDLPEMFHRPRKGERDGLKESGKIILPLGLTAAQSEGILIRRTLDLTQGDKKAAAKILGYSARTLYRKLKEHKIPLNQRYEKGE
ncbi:MAG TPA: sigma-54 dependent transcriptional regulator [bacterium]|nr:sigma-54 dependent transcriptional regulator [bacterium]HOL92754.1 sigma-54 dependent transcriptional regulator [bacterium]HPO99031.1 sigma-54 dependent transcriptional regulator [bacterium]